MTWAFWSGWLAVTIGVFGIGLNLLVALQTIQFRRRSGAKSPGLFLPAAGLTLCVMGVAFGVVAILS